MIEVIAFLIASSFTTAVLLRTTRQLYPTTHLLPKYEIPGTNSWTMSKSEFTMGTGGVVWRGVEF
jgi:hypothetical protein